MRNRSRSLCAPWWKKVCFITVTGVAGKRFDSNLLWGNEFTIHIVRDRTVLFDAFLFTCRCSQYREKMSIRNFRFLELWHSDDCETTILVELSAERCLFFISTVPFVSDDTELSSRCFDFPMPRFDVWKRSYCCRSIRALCVCMKCRKIQMSVVRRSRRVFGKSISSGSLFVSFRRFLSMRSSTLKRISAFTRWMLPRLAVPMWFRSNEDSVDHEGMGKHQNNAKQSRVDSILFSCSWLSSIWSWDMSIGK